jgi:hypothetical protein
MNINSEFKRWKLFWLLVGIPVSIQLIGLAVMISRHHHRFILNAITMMTILFIGVFFAWFFTLGTNLKRKNQVARPKIVLA